MTLTAESDVRTGKPRVAMSGTPTLEHVLFFGNGGESQPSFPTSVTSTAAPVDDESWGTRKADSNDALQESLHHFSDCETNQSIPLQLCKDPSAGLQEANHEKKQLMSNLPDVTGERSLSVPHEFYTELLDHFPQPIRHPFSANVKTLPLSPRSNSSASSPGPGISLDQTNTPDAILDKETRHHGTLRAEPKNHSIAITSPGSDSSKMSSIPTEPIASAKDIGMPTVVDIPADAKSVAILKTIKADKIKRTGSTTILLPKDTSNMSKAEQTKRAGPAAISIPQSTSGDFQTICADWGIKTVVPFTFENAIDGLFGKALTTALKASSSILGQVSHLRVLPERSSLVMLKNSPFQWISSTLIEFHIPEETLVQHGGEMIIIDSANVKIDYSENGTFSVLFSASRLGDDDRTWTWLESNVGLVARFQYEQELLPATLSHTGKNVSAELNQLNGITVLDLVEALRLPLGALINLPLVGRMLKSPLTCASFEYSQLLDRSSPPSILTGRIVFRRERLQLRSFDLSDPEISIVFSSSRNLVSVDEGQWTFQISAFQTALQLKTQVDYAAVDYLARFHVQPKVTLGLLDFLELLAPNQIKPGSQKALRDFTVDQADVVLDTSDWSAISCSGDMRFPDGLPSLFEYDAYSSDDIALTSTIEVPTHGYDVDVLAFQSCFDSRPEILAKQKDTTFAVEDDEIMVAAPLNNDELWETLALAVKEHAQANSAIIDFGRDRVAEVVSSTPGHIASDAETKDERVIFSKLHRASVVQMATAVVQGSPLPSPTIVTIASGTDGSAAGSARRASRVISGTSTPPAVIAPTVEEEDEIIQEQTRDIDGVETIQHSATDDHVADSQSDIFTSTWLDLSTQNGNQGSSLSIVHDSTIDGDDIERQTSVIPDKSVTSSTAPSPSPSLASSSPKFGQRELDQKSSTSSLGSEFQSFYRCTSPKPTLYTTPEDRALEIGPIKDAQEPEQLDDAESVASISGSEDEELTGDSQLSELTKEVSTAEATPTSTSPTTNNAPVIEAIHGFDFSDAFASSTDFTQIDKPIFACEKSLEHENEAGQEPFAPNPVHAVFSDFAPEENVTPTAELDYFNNVSPTRQSDDVDEDVTPFTRKSLDVTNQTRLTRKAEETMEEADEDETPTEEEAGPQRARRERAERRPARRVREPSSLEEISETDPPSTATPTEQVEPKATPMISEHIPSKATRPMIISSQTLPPRAEGFNKAATTTAATDDIRPIQSTTSDLGTNKRTRRKSLLPSKSMRNLLKRVSSFGNLKEQPLPSSTSRNLSTSHSETAVPLPPLVMNGSFASGTTEGWQVDAGRNNVKVAKQDPLGYKNKLVVTVRRSSLSGACLRQRLATEAGSKLKFSLKLKYDLVGDGVLSVVADGKTVARHQASSGQGEVFDVQGVFDGEERGTLLELQMKSPFGKMMIFEISAVVVEAIGH
ncbi:hypothetical protein E2P81_ATG07227 [Venturia nashicola]|nr:hypothetical protein E2P81_ATG07227 [Venturia nashicola]